MWIKLKSKWKENEAGKSLNIENDLQAQALIDTDVAEKTVDPTADVVTEAGKAFDLKLKSYAADAANEVVKRFAGAGGTTRPVIVGTHDNELDDPKLGFKSGMEFWYTWARAQRGNEECKKLVFGDGGYVKKMEARIRSKSNIAGANEAIDSEGGIFVLPEFSAELMMTKLQLADLRPYCRQFSMAGNSYRIRARVDKNHQTTPFGGINISRTFEGVPANKTAAKFEWIDLKPTKLMGWTTITDEMMEDAPAFASLFPEFFQEAFAAADEADILQSTGSGEPLGAFSANNPSKITVAKTAGQAAGTFTITNALQMRSQCYGYENAVWVMSQDVIPALGTFVIGTVPVFLPSAKSDVPDTLLGRPIKWSEYCPTLGTQGDVRLFNGREYLLGNRGGLNSAQSMHVFFLQGENTIKFWRRGDGQPLWRAPLTPVQGNTRSPFLDLQTRS